MICCNPSLTLAAAKARTEIRFKHANIRDGSRDVILTAQKPNHPGLGRRTVIGEVPGNGIGVSGSANAARAGAPKVFARLLRGYLSRKVGNRSP